MLIDPWCVPRIHRFRSEATRFTFGSRFFDHQRHVLLAAPGKCFEPRARLGEHSWAVPRPMVVGPARNLPDAAGLVSLDREHGGRLQLPR